MDIVITYVDITERFKEQYYKYVKKELEENRFRSYGVLDLQIKGIRKYIPYIKNIFVVVSEKEQVEGIDLSDAIIIEHKDIIPERYLPCFNSCSIEMFLWKIPGLAEEFIYFNDDIFVIDKIHPSKWFIKGKPVLFPKEHEIKEEENIFKKNCINSSKLAIDITGSDIKDKYFTQTHCARPFLKSSCEKVFNLKVLDIIHSLTRTRHSKNYNASLFNDYDYLSGKAYKMEVKYTYTNAYNTEEEIINYINEKENSLICINDTDYYIDFDEFKAEIRKALEANLKEKKYVKDIKKEKIKEIILNNTPLKVALCTISKNENLYIREWVEWYKNLGISKIFLYDNNDLDGERFEDVINDYIEEGFVEIIDRRGIIKTVSTDKDGQTLQGLTFKDCFYNHYKEFDYMCFFDIDEYLEIYNTYKDLNDFLHDFDEFDGIRVQWKMYGDNDKLYYENKPLYKRFKKESNASYDRHVKQILNCNKKFDDELFFCAHGVFNKKYNFVNVNKEPIKNVYMDSIAHDNLSVFLNHFFSKSTEEFLKRKYNKPSAVTGINNKRNFNIDFLKNQYFEHNKKTEEKEKFIDIFINSNNSVNVYMASLYKDGFVIKSIKSIIKQPQVKSLTLSANNYTDEQYEKVIKEINSPKLIIHRTNNEKLSFEKLRFVNNDRSTKYVAFCDDDLIFYDGYFRKMISECELLNAVVSYHGGILKKPLPIEHYYPDRITFTFNKNVKENKEVDIIGNGVSLFKRDWITYKQWKDLYNNSPEVSMDDITVSYTLRKNGKKLIVVKHSTGDVIEKKDNKDTVYNLYKKDDSIQTDWVNKYFISL